ncbi:MAG: hypothetical protein U7123_16905 [Potamolinea sp.]
MDNPDTCEDLIKAAEGYLDKGETYYQGKWSPVHSTIQDFIDSHKH